MSKKLATILVSSFILVGAFVAGLPTPQAVALNFGGKFAANVGSSASNAAARQSGELSRIQSRADAMITNRINDLNKLLSRIQSDTHLSADEKVSLTTTINTTITHLQSLKTKIDADTDATIARTDAQSIVTSYRVYVVLEPQARLLIIIDNLQTASTNVATLVTKVQSLLNTLKGEGKDMTNAQTALTDISTQLNTINGLLTTDKSLLTGVSVTTTNPQSIFTQVRKDLATVRADFAKIRSDFASVREDMHIILPKGSATTKPGDASGSAQ